MSPHKVLDDAQLENLKAIKEINERLCNVENKTNELDEIISLQQQSLINSEEHLRKLRNKQKKKSSWLSSLTNFVGGVIDTGKSYVGKIYENVTTPIIEKPKVEEFVDKENLIPEKKEDLAEEFTKIENDLTSKNIINEFNKIEIFFEEKGERPQNFREVNKLGEVNKEKKEIINLTTIPNNLNNGDVPNLSNNNGQSSSNPDNNGGDVDPKNKESKIKDSQEPVNDKNNREVPNLSNNNGQPSSNPNDNGGDNPKNKEYESQIKDLQETVTRQNIEYSRLLNELKQRISLQERKVLEKEEIIKQNQEKIEKREELIAKLQREKISAEEQKKNLEELNKKLEEGKNKSEKGETIFNTVVEVGVGALAGAVIGGVVGGPFGAVVGGVAGAVIEGVVGVVKSAFKAVKSLFGWLCS
ncbi:unnamed protein product [Meloidogyne enterolobii]|uniref:Uncharacterized protein n=1 Tax=Meloidogyne enterolobii TaxID=390850 RepID=A0ACB1AZN3_MELEN